MTLLIASVANIRAGTDTDVQLQKIEDQIPHIMARIPSIIVQASNRDAVIADIASADWGNLDPKKSLDQENLNRMTKACLFCGYDPRPFLKENYTYLGFITWYPPAARYLIDRYNELKNIKLLREELLPEFCQILSPTLASIGTLTDGNFTNLWRRVDAMTNTISQLSATMRAENESEQGSSVDSALQPTSEVDQGLRDQLSRLEQSNETLQAAIATLNSQFNDVNGKITQLTSENKALEEQIATQATIIENLQQQIRETKDIQQDSIERISTRVGTLESVIRLEQAPDCWHKNGIAVRVRMMSKAYRALNTLADNHHHEEYEQLLNTP